MSQCLQIKKHLIVEVIEGEGSNKYTFDISSLQDFYEDLKTIRSKKSKKIIALNECR